MIADNLKKGSYEISQSNINKEDVLSDPPEQTCWICFEGSAHHPLDQPCRCPKKVHLHCLARWQLQQAGRTEELKCRFCLAQYPDWKCHIVPEHLRPLVHDPQKALPFMAVVYNGTVHKIPVRLGPEGVAEFKARVKALFGFSEDVDFDVTFECKSPTSEEKLLLKGLDCYEAATHCAAVSAAKRALGVSSFPTWKL